MANQSFTKLEEKQILDYIIENNEYGNLRKDTLWKKMENEFTPKRDWDFLKNHFVTKLIYNLHEPAFKLTKEQIITFKDEYIHSLDETASCPTTANENKKRILISRVKRDLSESSEESYRLPPCKSNETRSIILIRKVKKEDMGKNAEIVRKSKVSSKKYENKRILITRVKNKTPHIIAETSSLTPSPGMGTIYSGDSLKVGSRIIQGSLGVGSKKDVFINKDKESITVTNVIKQIGKSKEIPKNLEGPSSGKPSNNIRQNVTKLAKGRVNTPETKIVDIYKKPLETIPKAKK